MEKGESRHRKIDDDEDNADGRDGDDDDEADGVDGDDDDYGGDWDGVGE